jgi:beta-phosphoglucomutase
MRFGVIFDMDGVMVDNIAYHIDALHVFCKRHDRSFTDEEFKTNISGKTVSEVMNYIFRRELTQEEINNYADEKESIYREIYKPHMKATKGLIGFLERLKAGNIPTAVATAAPPVNVEYVFEGLKAGKYFDSVVDGDMVVNGKPHPEIYLKAAVLLKMEPEKCIVIEDSLQGIQSGLNAGMKVIGITTVHTSEELDKADYVIEDFEEISLEKLNSIVQGSNAQ